MLRGLVLLVLIPALLWGFTRFFAAMGCALVGVGDRKEALFFGTLYGVACLVLTLIVRSIARAGKVRAQGIVRDLIYRQESVRSWISRTAGSVHVLRFYLETTDSNRHQFPRIPVEQAGKVLRGTLTHGEEVVVVGKPTRMNYLQAARIQVVSTGEQISMKGQLWSGAKWIWLLLILGFVGGMIIIAAQ